MVLRVGIVLAIFLAMCQLCAASFTETVYTATLTGAQVVPNAGNSTNFGTAIFTFDRHSNDLSIDVEVQHNIQGIISAAIWKGKRGVVPTQSALYNFTVPFSSNFRQLFILEDIGNYLVGDQITDFLYGRWFIQIYSVQFPNGAVRGQIEHRDRAYVRLDAINTIPQSTGTTAQGIALATFTFNNPKSQLAFDIVHGVVDPTGVDLYAGAENEIGTYFYELDQSTSPVFSNVKLTENEKTAFFEDLTYMNIKSKRNPSGDVRGQIITIDYVPDVAFTARLAGTSMVPNTNSQAKGAILVTYNCETYTLEYIMVHNAVRATRVVFGVGSPTQVGSAIYVADFNAFSPVYGSFKLTPQQEVRLYTKEMFVVLQSEFYPTGELRGQLTDQNDYYAYLSGTNVIPPVTGPGVGIATFRLQGSNQDELNYEILFQGVPEVIDVTLRRAPDGVNGPVLQLFDSRTSPVSGSGLVLKKSDRSDFVSEGVYVSVSNSDHPFGEIRGQIRSLNPCTERNQVNVPSDITTYALFSSDIFQYDSPLTFSQLDSYSKQASSPGSFLFPSFSSLVYSSNPNNGQGQSTYQQSYGRSIDGAVPIDSVGQNKNQSPASSKNSNSSASHLLASASLLLVSLIAAFLL